eukprot:TRINITY_DN54945_c0_g1_i2.p1 TRINITY_DN54945_c0_g1~~TRINITY_DN54945_c0_g1_i2.p1  ORF type:complete len:104 (-),score=8.74 TRINITY_DN54945_c0_g1_i2:211-522(-)
MCIRDRAPPSSPRPGFTSTQPTNHHTSSSTKPTLALSLSSRHPSTTQAWPMSQGRINRSLQGACEWSVLGSRCKTYWLEHDLFAFSIWLLQVLLQVLSSLAEP